MRRSSRSTAWLTLGYVAFACAWIFVSDGALRSWGFSSQAIEAAHVPKSLLFIAITAAAFYLYATDPGRSTPAASRSAGPTSGALVPLASSAVLALLVVSGVSLELWRAYQGTLSEARQTAQNLASTIAAQIGQTVSAVDVSLRSVSSNINHLPGGLTDLSTIQQQVSEQAIALGQVQSLFIVDRDGRLVAASDSIKHGTDLSQRDYFIALRQNPSIDLFVGGLIRSKSDGRVFIGMARALTDRNGQFAGVVGARLDPDFIEQRFNQLAIGTDNIVALLHNSGVLIARNPPAGNNRGIKPGYNPILLDTSVTTGTFDGTSPIDGVPRLYGFRRLDSVPLTVLVGRAREGALAPWRAILRNSLAALAVFLAVVTALTILLRRQALRQAQLIHELRLSETRFLSFLSNTPAIAWITDGKGRVIYGNHALARLTDRDEEDLAGRALDELLPDQEPGRHAARVHDVAEHLHNLEVVQEWPGHQGLAELLVQYFPLGEASGEHRVGGIALDITKQRAAERAIALHDRVLRSSPHGVVIARADDDMPLIYVNPAFERLTGYTLAEVVGRNCRMLQGDDHDQDGLIEVRAALIEQRETQVVLRNYRKDGRLFWNELRIAPVRDAEGRVSHYVGTLVDITERKNFEDQLAFHASHDLLTRLPNRNRFEDELLQAISQAMRDDETLAVVYLDLDHFRHANESVGRGGGDLLLKKAAERMQHAAGVGHLLGRIGGDEFAMVMTDHPSEETIRLQLKRLFDLFRSPVKVGELEVALSLSAGVALFPRDATTIVDLTRNAELAMMSAKQAGGGVAHFFEPRMDHHASDRLALENRLRHAVLRNELVLHYQPQIDAHTGKVIGVEALMRWQDPTEGLVYPAGFIGLAEQTGLIVPMGEWALREACRQAREWQTSGVAHIPVAVNVSIAQFRQPDFAQTVRSILQETGLAGKDLELEITESLVMDDPDFFIESLRQLKRLGVVISIDDFGTGYSSLNYLKRLPIDKLKIDRSFVGDITQDPDDAALCRSIVEIAHSLRLIAIAEGVETAAQANFLARHHCDHLQGYLFCKPQPAEAVRAILSQTFDVASAESKLESAVATVLVVDDDDDAAQALASVIASASVRVRIARTSAKAFEILATEPVAVVISDYRMPDINGVALLARVKLLYPETIRMIVTAFPGFESAAAAINQAAIFKFVVKPWNEHALRDDVMHAIELHRKLSESLRLRERLDHTQSFAASRVGT